MDIMKAYLAGKEQKSVEERLKAAKPPRFDLLPTGTLWVLAGWQNMSGRRVSRVVDCRAQVSTKYDWQYTHLFEIEYAAGKPKIVGVYERGHEATWQQLSSEELKSLFSTLQKIHAHTNDSYTWQIILMLRELFPETKHLHYS